MFVFTPAISGAYTITPNMINSKYSWWREDSLVYHPAMLISYGMKFLMDYSIFSNIKTFLGYDLNKTLIVADSGGFEIWSRQETIPVEEVLKWQFENGNIIVALDYPPRGIKKIEEVGDWEKCKKYTRKNTEAMIKYASSRKAENRKIYGVVHGTGLGELDDWWKEVIKPYYETLDGIVYAPRPPNNPKEIMLCMAHAYINDVKNLHLLAVSGTRTFIPIVYWQSKFKLITADSSTFTKISGRGNIIMPVFMSYVSAGTKGKVNIDYSNLECHCPACQLARRQHIKSVYEYHNTNAYFLSYLHNLFWTLAYIDGLKWLLEVSRKQYFDYAWENSLDLGWLDCVEEKGIEYCYKYYPNKVEVSPPDRNMYMAELELRSAIKFKFSRLYKSWW